MARMKLEGVGVAYPVYNAASQSLRKQLVSISTGGRVSAAKGHVATVQALDDINLDGMELIRSVVTIFENYAIDTEVLVASVRHPIHVVQSAEMGADVATMPFDVIEKLIRHPLTDIGLQKFTADWEAYQKETGKASLLEAIAGNGKAA